jgi:hypothetical protein
VRFEQKSLSVFEGVCAKKYKSVKENFKEDCSGLCLGWIRNE